MLDDSDEDMPLCSLLLTDIVPPGAVTATNSTADNAPAVKKKRNTKPKVEKSPRETKAKALSKKKVTSDAAATFVLTTTAQSDSVTAASTDDCTARTSKTEAPQAPDVKEREGQNPSAWLDTAIADNFSTPCQKKILSRNQAENFQGTKPKNSAAVAATCTSRGSVGRGSGNAISAGPLKSLHRPKIAAFVSVPLAAAAAAGHVSISTASDVGRVAASAHSAAVGDLVAPVKRQRSSSSSVAPEDATGQDRSETEEATDCHFISTELAQSKKRFSSRNDDLCNSTHPVTNATNTTAPSSHDVRLEIARLRTILQAASANRAAASAATAAASVSHMTMMGAAQFCSASSNKDDLRLVDCCLEWITHAQRGLDVLATAASLTGPRLTAVEVMRKLGIDADRVLYNDDSGDFE